MRRRRRRKSWFARLFSRKAQNHEETEDDPSSAPDVSAPAAEASKKAIVEPVPASKAPIDTRTPEGIKAAVEAARRLASGAAPPLNSRPSSTPAKAASTGRNAADALTPSDIKARVEAARRLASGDSTPAKVDDAPSARSTGKDTRADKPAKDKNSGKPVREKPTRDPGKPKAEPPRRPTTSASASASQSDSPSDPVDPSADPKAPSAADDVAAEPEPSKTWLAIYWRKAGGGSLVASLLIHLGLLAIASFIVTSVVAPTATDFLSGGGSKSGREASEQLAQQVKMRKRTVLNKAVPARKLVSKNITAAIALPDLPMDTIELPEMSSILGGNMGSGGFGSSGAGGGFGNGMGIGGMSGRTFKPITMFGKNLNARSIAVILDVSGSMTPHLRKVIEELDRVAKGSTVILYVGCGVARPPGGVRLNDETTETRRTSRFRPFWQNDHGPEEEVYAIMERRPSTYFIKSQGIQYAWISLLTDQVRNAEALYWFSDFQDEVDDVQMASVLENLKRRQQKLFIHASDVGSSFEKIRDQICLPSGGMVIQSR